MTKPRKLNIEDVVLKYRHVPLSFHSYLRYQFRFRGIAEDKRTIVAMLGGTHEDIKHLRIYRNEERRLGSTPEQAWKHIQILSPKGKLEYEGRF